MLGYLICMLDKGATSFCSYDNPNYEESTSSPISTTLLRSVVDYARDHELTINFLYGNHPMPDTHEKIIDTASHLKIVPLKLHKHYPEAIYVINPDDYHMIENIPKNLLYNLILRIDRNFLNSLESSVSSLMGRFKRLNVIIRDVDKWSDEHFSEYKKNLQNLLEMTVSRHIAGQAIELNLLTDRMLLTEMNNCDAGITHITVGPDGCFYLCPAFYFTNDQEYVSGSLPSAPQYDNQYLLEITNAPICRQCDAFHCKRCLYLNRKTTLEINTPSKQQCVVSHLERNASRALLSKCQTKHRLFCDQEKIPKIKELDPFERIKNNRIDSRTPLPIAKTKPQPKVDLAHMSDRELLESVYRMQTEILQRLKA